MNFVISDKKSLIGGVWFAILSSWLHQRLSDVIIQDIFKK